MRAFELCSLLLVAAAASCVPREATRDGSAREPAPLGATPTPPAIAAPSPEPLPTARSERRDSTPPETTPDGGTSATAADPDAASSAGTAPPTPPTTSPDDPWTGLTRRDVQDIVRGIHPRIHLSGEPRLTQRGDVWTIEYEPGGCSDWAGRITVHFSRGKVLTVEHDRRARYTGKHCM